MANQSTLQLIPIANIRDGVVIMKNGSLRMVIKVSAINFELRSNEEQIALLQGFQRFLNSIDFPIQIVVNSRKLDINPYIKTVNQIIEKTENDLLRIQAEEYVRFIKELSELSNLVSKNFYVVVPFYPVESSDVKGLFQGIKGLFKTEETIKELNEEQLQSYKNQLLQRVELINSGLFGLGLKTSLLEDEELKKLYYQYYNPES
jgi:type IV secretory pathway VirB4 component